MNIVELKKDKTEYHVQITIPSKDIVGEIDKELANIAKTAKMDGFRKGKVPVSLLKRKYIDSIRTDIVRKKIDSAAKDLIKEKNLNIVFDPIVQDLKNEENKDLEFTLKFDILPEIDFPDFKKISIEKPVLEVSEKDINEHLEEIAKFSTSYEKETKAKSQKIDQVTIDAIGYVDGKAFDGGKLESHKLVLGSGAFIPGFEDQLIGNKAGDDITVKVDFPKDYHVKDLAGKPSEFKVKIIAVHKPSVPKIDDEFAQKLKSENLDKLKEQIMHSIKSRYESSVYTIMKMKFFDKLEVLLKFDVPSPLLEREKAILLQQTQGIVDSEIKDMSDKEKDAYLDKLVSRRARIGLMLAEYVKKKNLNITQDDIRQAIIAQARNYPGQEQHVIEFYQKNHSAIENIKGPILEEKGVNAIFKDEITVKEVLYSKDKLEKLIQKELHD